MADEHLPKHLAEFQDKYGKRARDRHGVPKDHEGDYVGGEGRAADHEFGVLYEGPWPSQADGFAEHTRRLARALSFTSIPVHLRSVTPKRLGGSLWDEETVDLEAQYHDLLTTTVERYVVVIHQTVADSSILRAIAQPVLEWSELPADVLESIRMRNKRKILCTVWERDDVPVQDIEVIKHFGQVWVACQKNAKMLRDAGVEDVRVVPIPFYQDDPLLELAAKPRISGPVRFYNIGKWEPRKEQRNLIGAFLREFKSDEPVQLYLKTSPHGPAIEDYPDSAHHTVTELLNDEQVMANGWLPNGDLERINRSLRLIPKILSQHRILALHRQCDVYVSVSRGEGFDMPAYDAVLAGNRLVYTPSGGPQDFAALDDFAVERTGSVDCHDWYGWRGCHYLDYSVDDVQRAMRRAYEAVRANRARPRIRRHLSSFTAEAVGQQMRTNIEELLGEKWPV